MWRTSPLGGAAGSEWEGRGSKHAYDPAAVGHGMIWPSGCPTGGAASKATYLWRMDMKPVRVVMAVVLLLLAAFSGYGFLTSFEPGAGLAFRVGYPVVGSCPSWQQRPCS